MSDSETPILLTIENGLATITLNRPDQGNAMSLELVSSLADAVDRVAADPSARALLMTGNGRFFCVGGDLSVFHASGQRGPLLSAITARINQFMSALARMNKPVVIAVNGAAAGAGFALAMNGDIVLASIKAHFTMAYTAVGLVPDGGTTTLLPRLIGLRRTQELALTNRRVSAEEAGRIGLVTRVEEPNDLLSKARELALGLVTGPTRAFGVTRRLIGSSFEQSFETQLAAESRAVSEVVDGEDANEGIAAFLERRSPQFAGRN